MEAKQAFENAYNLSLNQEGLNEDARVQLHKLNRQQTVVGLVGRRSKLRPEAAAQDKQQVLQQTDENQSFDLDQAARIEGSLGKDDSDNLQEIAKRMIGQQEAAAGFVWPLRIEPAERGRLVRLIGSIEVKKDTPLKAEFRARRESRASAWNAVATAAVFGVFVLIARLARRPGRTRTGMGAA
jgi:hypothetical protein